jgi:hypothetical protein
VPTSLTDFTARLIGRAVGDSTTGAAAVGGVFIDSLGVEVSGPHPLFPFDEAAFCAIVRPLLLA